MSMILASHQPDFFPYMGYFYKIWKSDYFIFSDDVQFSKSGRHNYNDILTANGPQRFTLPVSQRTENLNEIQIAADDRKIEEMLKTLRQNYQKAPHFKEVFPLIASLLWMAPISDNLARFNEMCIINLCYRMNIIRGFERSSGIPVKGRRDARIIELCKYAQADTYYSGSGAKDYHVEADYTAEGINLVYSDYCPVEYRQTFCGQKGDSEFVAPNLSVIDYLMNCGFKNPWEVSE